VAIEEETPASVALGCREGVWSATGGRRAATLRGGAASRREQRCDEKPSPRSECRHVSHAAPQRVKAV
jgi:hypothetical protein